MTRILAGLPQDEYLRRTGRIQALMEILTLPSTLDLKAKEIDEHRRTANERTQSESLSARARAILATAGSPYFKSSGR